MVNPFDDGFYESEELRSFGFKSIGADVFISKKCTILGLGNISIGSFVRIDDFCILNAADKGFIQLGSYIHIGSHSCLFANDGIVMDDFSGLSQGVRVYSRSGDYSGKYLTNPTVPAKYTMVTCGTVKLRKHVVIGNGSVIMPSVVIGEGSSVGALSLVNKPLEAWGVYAGVPVRKLKERSKELLRWEAELWGGKQI
jgi:galactoside O-acetyltransferase